MKWTFGLLLAITLLSQGCEIVGDIFKTGYYTGLIVVFLFILLILFLIGFFKRK
jgi:hypothetical protein